MLDAGFFAIAFHTLVFGTITYAFVIVVVANFKYRWTLAFRFEYWLIREGLIHTMALGVIVKMFLFDETLAAYRAHLQMENRMGLTSETPRINTMRVRGRTTHDKILRDDFVLLGNTLQHVRLTASGVVAAAMQHGARRHVRL